MAAINVDKMNLKELIALEAKLQSAIAEARARARSDIRKKIADLAGTHGFSMTELFGGNGKSKQVSPPKYANPDDSSDTWTGRGRKPFWLVGKLKKGAKLEDFAI